MKNQSFKLWEEKEMKVKHKKRKNNKEKIRMG